MSRARIFTEPLNAGRLYHVYNQTNNRELLFLNDKDRWRFLYNLERFVSPYADILAYNLLPNHFHLLIEVKTKKSLLTRKYRYFIRELPPGCKALVMAEEDNMDLILKNRFTAMLSGYATYFNIQHRRRGNFLHRPFCRKWINTIEYFEKVAYYIHANGLHHGLYDHILDQEWSSYHSVMLKDDTILALEKLFEYFGGEDACKKYHLENRRFKEEETESFIIEEDTVFKQLQLKE